MKCPYCKKENCINDLVYLNTENYGGGAYHLPCIYCGEMLYVSTLRICKIVAISKSQKSKSESDF